jgi:hypothetical protein
MSANAEVSNPRPAGNTRSARCDDHVMKTAVGGTRLLPDRMPQRCTTLRNVAEGANRRRCRANSSISLRLDSSSPRHLPCHSPGFSCATGASPERQRSMYGQHQIATTPAPSPPARLIRHDGDFVRLRGSPGRAHRSADFRVDAGNIRSVSTDTDCVLPLRNVAIAISLGTAAIRFTSRPATVGPLAARTTS